jgi:hypothetical protein
MGANSSPGYKIVLSLADLKLVTNGNTNGHPGLEFAPNSRVPFFLLN